MVSNEVPSAPLAEVARLSRELEEAELYEQKLRERIVAIRDELAAGHTARALSLCNQALNEIDNAPEVKQSIFQRCAGESEPMVGAQLFDRLGHLRSRILDKLRFIENHRVEVKFLQRLEVAPQQGVIRHDQIVLWNSRKQPVPIRTV